MPRVRPKSSDREPALIAELRDAIRDASVNNYRLAQKAGIDEAAVRKFLSRERSLSLDSAARLAEALGLRIVRPSRPRKFAGTTRIENGRQEGEPSASPLEGAEGE
jgi:DNA-binding phage protein